MADLRTFPIPPNRLPFVNAEIAQIERNGRPWLATSTWGGENVGVLFLIDPQTGRCERRELPEKEPGAYMLKTAPDGRLYLGGGAGALMRYDPRSDRIEMLVKGEMSSITWGGCISGDYAVWTASPGDACVYDCRAGRLLHVLKPLDTESPPSRYGHRVIPCPDGKVLFGMNVPHARLILLDPRTGERRSFMPEALHDKEWTRDTTFFDDHTFALLCSPPGATPREHNELLFFNYPSMELQRRVPGPPSVMALGSRACLCAGSFYAHADQEGSLWRLKPDRSGWELACEKFIEGHSVMWPLQDRAICAVNVEGEFVRLELASREIFRHELDSTGVVGSHALRAIPETGRVFGGPFINQRFWELELASGQGRDLGRAAPGAGQINGILWEPQTRRVLLASYTTCTITAFDPEKPAHWPENPRVLARVRESQMRPVSFVHDGRYVWLASSPEYGQLGGALSRIDPRDGGVRTWRHLVKDQTPNRVVPDPARGRVYVSTDIHADCQSAPPTQRTARLLAFDTAELKIAVEHAPYDGCDFLAVLALLSPGCVLGRGNGKLFIWEPASGKFDDLGAEPPGMRNEAAAAPDGALYVCADGKIGRLRIDGRMYRFEPIAEGTGHFLHVAGGKLWYEAKNQVHALAL